MEECSINGILRPDNINLNDSGRDIESSRNVIKSGSSVSSSISAQMEGGEVSIHSLTFKKEKDDKNRRKSFAYLNI